MNTSAPSPTPVAPAPVASYWRLQLTATPEPLLLSRVLQKFSMPEIEVLAVRFETGAGTDSQLELEFAARPERARLVAARLRKIIGVHGVGLRPLG